MDIQQLEYFITVAQQKSFFKASSVLYMTVPGVRRKINQLEEYLQFPLFERSNQGVELTPAGQAFYKDAVEIVRMMRKAVESGRQMASKAARQLYVGTVLPSHYLRGICQAYSQYSTYKLPLSYRQLSANKGTDALLSHYIDMHLAVGDSSACPGVRHDLLFCEKPQCIMSVKHPLSAKEQIFLSDLQGETLLLPPPGKNAYFDKLRELIVTQYPGIFIETLEDAVSTYMYIDAKKAFCITAALGGLDIPALCHKPVDPKDWNLLIEVYLARRDEPNPYIDDFVCVTRNNFKDKKN